MNSIFNNIKQSNWILSIAVSLVSIIAVISLGNIMYESIDDFFMQSIASGFFGGKVDEHLIYSNFIIGKILNGLFTAIPSFNWYGGYLITCHIISWTIIFYVFKSYLKSIYTFVAFYYLFLAFGVYFLQNLQFTTTSTLLAVSSLMLIYKQIDNSNCRIKDILFPAALIIFSSMIRMHSAVLSIILASPIFFTLLPDRKKFFQSVIIVGSLFFISNLSQKVDSIYYHQDKDWGEYYDHFFQSAIFNDDNSFYVAHQMNSEKPYLQFGWSDNDLAVFTSFFRDYPEIFNSENYSKLKGPMDDVPFDQNAFTNNLIGKFRNVHLILCISLVFIFSSRIKQISIFIACIFMVAVVAYIVTRFQLKDRVLYSMVFVICTLSIWSFLTSNVNNQFSWKLGISKKKELQIGVFAMLLLLLLAFNTFKNQWINNNQKAILQGEILNKQLEIISKKKDVLIAIFGASVKFEASGPLSTEFTRKNEMNIYPISAFNKSPLFFNILNIPPNRNLADALSVMNVEFVTNNSDDYGSGSQYIQKFYKEHYNCDRAILDDTSFSDCKLRIYKLGPCLKSE